MASPIALNTGKRSAVNAYWDHVCEQRQSIINTPIRSMREIAGLPFLIEFPDQKTAASISLPFPESDKTSAAFSITIWDSKTSPISPKWTAEDLLEKGAIAGFEDNDYPMVYDIGARSLSIASLPSREAIYWTHDLCSIPYWEKGSFLRNLLHFGLPIENRRLVHAAAVGTEEGGVLIVGKGGAGKTTTALSCLDTRLSYLSDDYCALSNDGTPFAHQVFTSAKVSAESAKRLSLPFSANSGEKEVIDIQRLFPEKLISSFPLKAILFPTIGKGEKARIVPANRSAVLQELAASTIFQLPGKNNDTLPFLAAIVRKLPCFRLHLSQDMRENGNFLEHWIAHDC